MKTARTAMLPVLGFALLILSACGQPTGSSNSAQQAGSGEKPDFSGTWDRYPDNWAGPDPDHPSPPGGPFPLKEPYAAQYAALLAKSRAADAAGTPLATPTTRCLPEGMPDIMSARYPIEIMQNSRRFVVLAELLSQTRRVYIGEKMPPLDDIEPSFNGYSVAHWEGDTLVVDTVRVRPDVLFFNVPHSINMKITERIRLTAPDMLENKIVIEDPEYLKTPYRFTFQYKRKDDYKIMEFICENNQTKVDAEGKSSLILDADQNKR